VVRLVLTLISGVNVELVTDRAEALQILEAVRRSWRGADRAVEDLVIGTADEVTDWVRMAHISAVQIAPLPEEDTHVDQG
jgi:hypothetical protein